jgi:LytS/YehU family sensor histidine kinase
LASDLEALQLYADMERMRFGEKFTFHVKLGEDVKPQTQLILPLVIQPFVENAILHAFTGLEREGRVRLGMQVLNDSLYVSITDDGIGRQSALALKWRKQKYATRQERRESGITVTAARIQQAWGRKWGEGKFKITDLYDRDNKPAGTCVEFYLPLNYDKTTFS